MNIRRIVAALALLLITGPASAQVTNPWPRFIPVRPDGSVIDPGSVGGGGGGGIVTQGSAATDTAVNRWPVLAYQGGTWSFGLSGPIPAGSNNIGAVTQSGTWTVAATQSGTWSFGLTGAIPTGSNVIGAVTQSGGPWTVSGTVNATQSGAWNVGLSAGAAVLADLRVSGAAVTTGNPVPVSVGNFPASQAVTNAGTFAVQNTAALPAGSNTIGSINNISGSITLPTGAATAANQALEISAINSRVAYGLDFNSTLTASQSQPGTGRDAGVSPSPYSKFVAFVSTAQAGTILIEVSTDNAGYVVAQSIPAAAGSGTTLTQPITTRYTRVRFVNGSTAGAAYIASALSVN